MTHTFLRLREAFIARSSLLQQLTAADGSQAPRACTASTGVTARDAAMFIAVPDFSC